MKIKKMKKQTIIKNSIAKRFFHLFIAIATIITFSVFFFNNKIDNSIVYAGSQCPAGMTDLECLQYLQDKSEEIDNKKKDVQGKIDSENKNQQTLNGKVSSVKLSISGTELSIEESENQIALLETQIRILSEDIIKTQREIEKLTKEIENREEIVQKQAFQSYISKFRSPLEAILSASDFSSMVRRLKYLQTLRDEFKILLKSLAISRQNSEDARDKLKTEKTDVESKKGQIEVEKQKLENEKRALDTKRAELQYLIAESKKTEDQLQAEYNQLKASSDAYTEEITQLIFRLYDTGQIPIDRVVNKGDIIGFQGHTGWSYGSHLHFEVRRGSNQNPLSGFYSASGGYLYEGTLGLPLTRPYITQYFGSKHKALDLVSKGAGNQSGDKYYANKGDIKCDPNHSGWHSLRGEGAPIYAVSAGRVTVSRTDSCGGKYVLIDHNNGTKTLYLHLR